MTPLDLLIADVRKALRCLYIAVDEAVARDVSMKPAMKLVLRSVERCLAELVFKQRRIDELEEKLAAKTKLAEPVWPGPGGDG